MVWTWVLLCIWTSSAVLASILRSTKTESSPSSYLLLVLSLGLCMTKALGQWVPYTDSTLFSLLLVAVTVLVYPSALLKHTKQRWHETCIYLTFVLLLCLALEIVKVLLVDTTETETQQNVLEKLCIAVELLCYVVMTVLQGIGVLMYPHQALQPLITEYRISTQLKEKFESYQYQIRSLQLFYTYRGLQMPRFKEKQLDELSEKADDCSEEATSLLYKPQYLRFAQYMRILSGLMVSVICGLLAGFYAIEAVARVALSACGYECGYSYSFPGLSEVDGWVLLCGAGGVAVLQVLAALAGVRCVLQEKVTEETLYMSMAGTVAVCGLALPSALHNLFPRLHGAGHGAMITLAEGVIQCIPLCVVLICAGVRVVRQTRVPEI